MKAFLITPGSKSVDAVDITDEEDIVRLVGFPTIIFDEIGPDGDRLYFDEECFLRGSSGRFQVDNVVPVSGNGVVVGATDDGTLRDVVSDMDGLAGRLKYL